MPADALRNLQGSLVIVAVVVAALVLGSAILIPLAVAVIVAFMLQPVVRLLEGMRIPRAAAVAAVLLVTVAGLIMLSVSLSSQLLSLTGDLDRYKGNLIGKARIVGGLGRGEGALQKAGETVVRLGREIERELGGRPEGQAPSPPMVVRDAKAPGEVILTFADVVSAPLTRVALMLLFVLFLLLQHHDLRDRIVRLVGIENLSDTTAAMSDAGARLSQLFLAQAALNAAFGVFAGLALWLIGVPNPLLWGVLAFFMRFVPFIGSFVAAVPPLLLAAAVDPGWTRVIATLAVFALGEPVMGHLIEPLVLGRRAGLSPFAMVAAASFWTLLWGPVGLVLAAPLTLAVVVLGRYIPGLEVFTVLLGDQPALLPEQEFYQRALSGDSVAAERQIEDALDDASAPSLADRILLPALRLAARDQRRGKLDPEQAARMRGSLDDVCGLLSDVASAPSKPRRDKSRVVVVPARGPVDAIAAECVACILRLCTPADSTAVGSSTGLTALASIGEPEGDGMRAIVIVTVGGIERRHLALVLRRALRDFGDAELHLLDATAEKPDRQEAEIGMHRHASLANLVASLSATDRPTTRAADAVDRREAAA